MRTTKLFHSLESISIAVRLELMKIVLVDPAGDRWLFSQTTHSQEKFPIKLITYEHHKHAEEINKMVVSS